MTENNWNFCLKKHATWSFPWFPTPVRVLPLPGQELIGTGYLSHAGLLQMGSIGYVAFLPSGWIGRCTLGLALTHGFLFSELPEKPANLSHLKTRWARFAFHWYDYLAALLFPLWELQMLCYEWMLWLILFNGISKILKKLFQLLMLNKYKLERWFYKTDWP